MPNSRLVDGPHDMSESEEKQKRDDRPSLLQTLIARRDRYKKHVELLDESIALVEKNPEIEKVHEAVNRTSF
jgi:hypothetical protein